MGKQDRSLKLMGRKKGMMRIFDEKGTLIVCTVVLMEPNVVVQLKEEGDYKGVQLGAIRVKDAKKKNVTKPLVGHFSRAKVEPRKYLLESRVESVEEYRVGQEIGVGFFEGISYVDVCGTSKGKGFQGVMKRHGFKGGPASHGSGFHRTGGSTGMRSTPGWCLPKTKKPGRMGGQKVTVEGLQLLQIDVEKQVVFLKGAIPGARNGLVYLRKSIKRERFEK